MRIVLRFFFVAITLIVFNIKTFGQDLIIRKDDQEIKCKILKVDSVNINITVVKNDKVLNTYIQKDEVKSYFYNGKIYNLIDPNISMWDTLQNKNFIYFSNNIFKQYKTITYSKKWLADPQIVADGENINPYKVKFLSYNNIYLANSDLLSNPFKHKGFLRCIEKGRINVFDVDETIVLTANRPVGVVYNYMAKGFGDLMTTTDWHIAKLTRDNIECVNYIKPKRTIKIIKYGVIVGGCIVMAVFGNSNDGLTVGGLMYSGGWFSILLSDGYGEAISIYNRNTPVGSNNFRR